MKFVKKLKKWGFDSQQTQNEAFKYSITRFSDGKMYWTDRLPRVDSKVWTHDFLVWNNHDNQQVMIRRK